MKTGQKILLGLLIGGAAAGGYYLYKKNKDEKDTLDPVLPDDQPNPGVVFPGGNTQPKVATQDDYTEKVKRLQRAIRVTADGKVGPQTLAQLRKFIKADQGVNAANIDSILKTVEPVAGAVWSLIYRKDGSDRQYWWDTNRAIVNSKGIDFSAFVPPAYMNVTGRSAYTDYKITAKANNTRNTYHKTGLPTSMKGLGNPQPLTNLI
ncbi:MAG: hypothetical protein ACK5XN_11480 [Bacteroidota bacterium]|jgi:hypothetical protein